MRKLLATLAIVSLIAGVTAAVALGATKTVRVGDNFFSKKSLTISRGTTVKWSWQSTDNPHNVAGKGFKSTVKSSGSYKHTFRKRGKYIVICQIHPTQMRMTVKVQ
ncbi:MAG TPA: plastocyanin/azurin family copper-binding protein [Thermoleophilaceae bacterium]